MTEVWARGTAPAIPAPNLLLSIMQQHSCPWRCLSRLLCLSAVIGVHATGPEA